MFSSCCWDKSTSYCSLFSDQYAFLIIPVMELENWSPFVFLALDGNENLYGNIKMSKDACHIPCILTCHDLFFCGQNIFGSWNDAIFTLDIFEIIGSSWFWVVVGTGKWNMCPSNQLALWIWIENHCRAGTGDY